MFNIFFIKIIIPGWTKNKWVKMGFPHLRAKIWENHATISCFLFLVASFSSIATISLFFFIITTDFFTSSLLFKWYVRFPTGFRRFFTSSICALVVFTATVPGALKIIFPPFLAAWYDYFSVISALLFEKTIITYYVSLSLILASCLQFCVSLSGYIYIIVMMSW